VKISESCCGSLAPLDLAEIILRVRLKEFVSIFEETHRFSVKELHSNYFE